MYDLHKQFHEAAAKVLDLAVAGKTDDAKLAMSMGSPFIAASSALTHEIVQWRDQK